MKWWCLPNGFLRGPKRGFCNSQITKGNSLSDNVVFSEENVSSLEQSQRFVRLLVHCFELTVFGKLSMFLCCCIKMMMHRGGKIDHQKWHPSQQLHCGVHSQWALSDHIPLCYRASAWHTSIFSPWLEGPGPPRIKPASRFYPAWIIRKR